MKREAPQPERLTAENVDLGMEVHGTHFSHPLLTASGTFGYGIESADLMELSDLGAVVTKGLSPKAKKGNPAPRIWETEAGLINSIGLENPGIEKYIQEIHPRLKESHTRVVVNFFGAQDDDYVECARQLASVDGVVALEVNLSCPNVKAGGLQFGTNPQVAAGIVRRCAEVSPHPLWVKLCPVGHTLVEVCAACVDAGAKGLTLGNTLPAMAIDPVSRRPRVGGVTGGLSGPAIRPVAVRAVHVVHQAKLGVPLIGVGGIRRAEDVCEFLLAGASLVQVGTQSLVEPSAPLRIRDDLADYLAGLGVGSARELVGALRLDAG